jgi:hypothetical protein
MEVSVVILQLLCNVASAVLSAWVEGVGTISMASEWVSFGVQTTCTPEACPGSQFSPIAAAWANIGYVTHSDVLNYVSTTKFGLWAPLLYVCAALAALVGVAINMPMRTYVWFMLGPAIYGFLIGTTSEVQGVNWVVANQAQDMTDVWRDAEVGLSNTNAVAERNVLQINGREGPTNTYVVAYPMVFLDELFSATSNLLVDWLGVYRHEGTGAGNSNLARVSGSPEGPWYLLSSLKWSMLENVVGGNLRNPDFRDALVTFLGSECGDAFKKGIDSGKYIAASSPYGKKEANSVFRGRDANNEQGEFADFVLNLDTVAIPTPRSLARVFEEGKEAGQFGGFAPLFDKTSGEQNFFKQGRTQQVVCSEYLYSIIQMIRFEAGHWYWQMLRSCPNGLTRDQCLRTLFYGWDVRREEGGEYASPEEMNVFVKNLIMVYILRNELLYAPQITEVNQRFSPSEQSRSFSEAHVRTMGSKAKYQELYNWAVLMPHMQGILVYFLIVAYPFAAMVMVLPGYYKAFLTWISFFAWVKLWDVGFAVVTVLERSVWAMIGNTTTVATMANNLIEMSVMGAGTGIGCDNSNVASSTRMSEELCAVPKVCSIDFPHADSCSGQATNQREDDAWGLLDKLLVLSAGADLDLANGYYIYIMAALYFAVPAVTGQLVLGAKAGAASMLNSAIGGVAGEAGKAAMTGYQHQAVNQAMGNSHILGQAAEQKGYRQAMMGADGKPINSSFASAVFGAEQNALDEKFKGSDARRESGLLNSRTNLADTGVKGWQNAASTAKSVLPEIPGVGTILNAGAGGGGGGGGAGPLLKKMNAALDYGTYTRQGGLLQQQADTQIGSARLSGDEAAAGLREAGYQAYRGNVEAQARQNAGMVAWEARNQFAAHASAMAGIAGANTGALTPGHKPADMRGMGMLGELNSTKPAGQRDANGFRTMTTGSDVRGSGFYGGGQFITKVDGMAATHKSEVDSMTYTQPPAFYEAPLTAIEEVSAGVGQGIVDIAGLESAIKTGIKPK